MATQTRVRKANAKMLYIVEQYKKAHPEESGEPIEPFKVASWAYRNGLYKRPPVDPEEVLRKEIARALGNEFIVDAKGRDVRKNHAIMVDVRTADGVKRRSRWYTIYEAPPNHIKVAFQFRRRAALSDVMQLTLDFDSYNDFNKFSATLEPMDFNFNKDLEEQNQPPDWPEEDPENDGEDEDA
jgi:hypothetical protein